MSRWRRCTVAGCLRPAKARGLCDAHYNRSKHAGLKPERPIRSLETLGPSSSRGPHPKKSPLPPEQRANEF
jgi:hypothetical protein